MSKILNRVVQIKIRSIFRWANHCRSRPQNSWTIPKCHGFDRPALHMQRFRSYWNSQWTIVWYVRNLVAAQSSNNLEIILKSHGHGSQFWIKFKGTKWFIWNNISSFNECFWPRCLFWLGWRCLCYVSWQLKLYSRLE